MTALPDAFAYPGAFADDAVYFTHPTPDGPFGVIATAAGTVLASGWTDSVDSLLGRIAPAARPSTLRQQPVPFLADRVAAYYAGELTAIDDVVVRQTSGSYRTAAWLALRTVQPGAPLTYSEFAALSGRARAVRAAAGACAANAAALFVPCHRVVRTDGTLGGFAWGTTVKASLLAHEQRHAPQLPPSSSPVDPQGAALG